MIISSMESLDWNSWQTLFDRLVVATPVPVVEAVRPLFTAGLAFGLLSQLSLWDELNGC